MHCQSCQYDFSFVAGDAICKACGNELIGTGRVFI